MYVLYACHLKIKMKVWIVISLLTTLGSSVSAGGCGGCGYCTKLDPCVNGVCITTDGGEHYSCRCYPGWQSTNCNIVDCSTQAVCNFKGSCTSLAGGTDYSCACKEGWKGKDCGTIDCESAIYCINGGTCHSISGGSQKLCECAYGWSGENCEEIDICTPYTDANIVFAIDVSKSQGGVSDFEHKLSYVKNFTSNFPVGPVSYRFNFSVVTYSTEPTVHFYLNEYQNMTELLSAMDNISPDLSGVSYTGKMLKTVREDVFNETNGANPSVVRYLIVLTDGLSSDVLDTKLQADFLRTMGVKTYAIGTGSSVLHEELIDIATWPSHVFTITTPDALQSILFKSMYGCEDCYEKITDVALVMDVSSSIKSKETDTLIKAATHIVRNSNTNTVHFSFTTFSAHHQHVYNLQQYTNVVDHVFEINAIRLDAMNDASSVSGPLSFVSSDAFNATNGGRSGARKVAIIFSAAHFTDNTTDIETTAQNLKDNGVIVVAVGVGRNADATNLATLASDPSLIYVLGEDMHTDVAVLSSLDSLLEYTDCSAFMPPPL